MLKKKTPAFKSINTSTHKYVTSAGRKKKSMALRARAGETIKNVSAASMNTAGDAL